MKLEKYEAIWFDVFWTLIENKEAKKYWKQIMQLLKSNIDISSYKLMEKDYGTNPKKYFSIFDLNEKINLELLDLFEKERQAYYLKPYTKALLRFLQNKWKKLFFISNLSSLYVPIVEQLLKDFDFDKKYYSCYLGLKKNVKNPEIFHKVVDDLQIPANKILFTGDNPINDLEAPKGIWIDTVHINGLVNNILKW